MIAEPVTRTRGWHLPALLFALVWLSCVWFGSWPFNPNNATRLFAAIAIAETGDARIDDFADMTIDKARFDGHFYMDKAPGITLMALPVVVATNLVTGESSSQVQRVSMGTGMDRFLTLRMRVAIAFSTALLTALAAVALLDLGTGITGNRAAGLFAALGFALGTPVWGWSTTLFGHAPVAALLVLAIWAIWRGTQGDARAPRRCAAIAGLSLGWAVVIEHGALLTALPVAIWALWRSRDLPLRTRLTLNGVAVAAGLAALIPLIAYNVLAFGTPFRLGYSGVVGFEGMQQGLFGLTYPKPDVLWEILFGARRGLLWVAPVLLLAPFGLVVLLRHRMTRDIGMLAAAGAIVALLYNASYIYWDGGNATGPRHALPAIAFLAIALAALWASADRWERWIGAGLLVASIAINLVIAASEILAPAAIADPLRDHIWPRMFLGGQFRTIPNVFWGWSPWSGLYLYLTLAAAIVGVAVAHQLRTIRD